MNVMVKMMTNLNVILNLVQHVFACQGHLLFQSTLVLVNYVTQLIVSVEIRKQSVLSSWFSSVCVGGFGLVRLDNI